MINDKDCMSWDEFYDFYGSCFETIELCRVAFDGAFILPINKDDLFMSGSNGEYMGGSCPRGADGAWVENLTMYDEFIHYEELLTIGILEPDITDFIYRFLHTFGKSE